MEQDKKRKVLVKDDEYKNKCIIKLPKLKTIIVENILSLLYLKDFTISELLVELQRRLPYSSSSFSCSSYKLLKKYLVYLVDCELISYDGQRQVYTIEDNGYDILIWISKEKKRLMAEGEDIIITIERGRV
jgi:DNA-binding transcriptional regulator GbsR (MarR family)